MKIQTVFLALLLTLPVSEVAMAQQGAAPAQKPAGSKAALDTLVGAWVGPVAAGPATLTFVLHFKLDSKGELQGTFSVPETGGTSTEMSDIQFADGKLSFKIPPVAGEYTATYANGALDGLWRQGGNPPEGVPVVLKKGEYVAPNYALKMSPESFGLLAGTWTGTLSGDGPQGPVTLHVVLRFETDKKGDRMAFMDSPDQHATGIPVNEASFSAGKLVVRIEALQGEYNATVSGNSMTGEWAQLGNGTPLTMTRK